MGEQKMLEEEREQEALTCLRRVAAGEATVSDAEALAAQLGLLKYFKKEIQHEQIESNR